MNLIYPLCSSSKGNATFIGTPERGVLLDCGIGIRNLSSVLKLNGINLSAIDAVFVTHEHSDHIKGLCKLSENIPLTVYGNVSTLKELIGKNAVARQTKLKEIDKKAVVIDGMEITAFRTSHDSADSMGYHVTFLDGKRFSLCTDLGFVSDEVERHVKNSDFVILESNYDEDMLQNGSYPCFLKQRIQGKRGHLSNRDCAAEICKLVSAGVERFALGHLSEENNRPEIALQTSLSKLQENGMKQEVDFTMSVAPKMTVGKVFSL